MTAHPFPFLDDKHAAIAFVAGEQILYGTARPCIGRHRGRGLSEPNERSAALAQVAYVARHRRAS